MRQDRMLRDLVEKAVQSFSPGLNEVVVEALHHALHHKLLWQRLRTQQIIQDTCPNTTSSAQDTSHLSQNTQLK